MDRNWIMNQNQVAQEYINGLNNFLDVAKNYMSTFGLSKIRCPCRRCGNLYQFNLDYLYKVWTFHGEVTTPIIDMDPVNEVEHVSDDEEDDTFFDMLNDLRDAKVVGSGGVQRGDNNENMPTGELGGSYMSMFEEAQRELYSGCTNFSAFSFLVKLMHVKVLNGWSNKSFDMLLQLLGEVFPKPNAIPSSHYEAKKMLRELGLGYESIHACKNDCILFWNDHEGKDTCPMCKELRYKVNEANKKKLPQKVLRYFPLKPRLKRLFLSKHMVKDMRLHKEKRVEIDGVLRYPTDAESWKEFDKLHETFADDPRIRLGLTTDDFNLFGNMSNAYSMWSVLLVSYNLPPWKMTKPSYMIMSLLIRGSKALGKEIDVYLRPLINELKEVFRLHDVVMWTIHDFPAYGTVSGWSTKGYKACPVCLEDTTSQGLYSKICYTGHRRFLHLKHSWRKNKSFNQKVIFFELEYWSDLKLKHNLDVMHIEKNICDALSDTIKARLDMQDMGIRSELHLSQSGDRNECEFCHFLKSVKFPDGYAANISRNVNVNDGKLYGLKTDDCHVLLQRLLPVAIRKFLPKDICGTVVELCDFFKKLTSRTLHVADLNKMGEDIVFILCKMERIFPPAFFDIMVHLAVHLPREAILGGPVSSRWIYPFERPEGSIAEGYVVNEALTFTSLYMGQIETRFTRSERNKDVSQSISCTLKTHWYVLNNCKEVDRYRKFHSNNILQCHEVEFPLWPQMSYTLILGPDVEVRLYDACIVNGVRGSWKVVQKVQHREIYEVTEKEDDNSDELEPQNSSNNEPNQEILLDEISLMVRDDLEIPHLCRVDIQPQHVELLDTQSGFCEDMYNFINDKDEDTELESNGEEQTFLSDDDTN
ncbi:hypothetical protein Pfo_007056 [Paulownia fortunei]|nr:hypothetical protein Pfo_007056 [Paulownia fortunei]